MYFIPNEWVVCNRGKPVIVDKLTPYWNAVFKSVEK